jgi:hypothetical protein
MHLKKISRNISLVSVILLLAMFCMVNSAAAQSMADADTWQYEFTIYGWFPSIDGTLKYPDPGGDISADTSDILDSLNFVFMGTFVAQKNKLSFGADVLYMDLSNSTSTTVTVNPGPGPGVPVNVTAGLGLKSWVVTGIVGYDVAQSDKNRTAVVGGFRYLDLSADMNLTGSLTRSLSGSEDFWDVIVGFRGAFMLNEKWYVPYYADIGAGQSNLTWQLYAGIGYNFSWGNIRLGYRYLEYDQDDDKFVQDLKFYGPVAGIGFRF